MKRNKKIAAAVILAFVGLPMALGLTVWAWSYLSDQTNGTLISSGNTRRYLLYVPKTYQPSKPTPLVISLHPAAAWPALERDVSGWNHLADEHGFIVVYPAGSGAILGTFTRGANVWPMGPSSLPRDVKFISDLIDKLEARYNIDPARVYADGMSNGGGMAFALSCKLSSRIAAIGAVAAAQTLSWDRCGNAKPVPTIAFHGSEDKFAPYQGGKSPLAPDLFPSIPDWAAHVAQRNRCKEGPSKSQVTANVRRRAYMNCAGNADVVLYTIEGGGHAWPGGKPLPKWLVGRTTRQINATRLMWAFFVQHPLRLK